MRKSVLAAVALAVTLAACEKKSTVNVVSSPYPSGQKQSQPVIYNGKPYTVGFTYRGGQDVYDVSVAGKGGRPLGGKAGDRKIVEQIGTSTVRHFACRSGEKGRVVPGSSQHTGKAWKMHVKCA